MKHVFIAWSGARSKEVARIFKTWLPDVLPNVRVWFSDDDIESGSFWSSTIQTALEDAFYGIACVTPENVGSVWMHFEAGAISNRLRGNFCPYLHGLRPADLAKSPLSQLQGKRAEDVQETGQLVFDIAKAARDERVPVPDDGQIDRYLEKFWPDLEEKVEMVPEPDEERGQHEPIWYLERILAVVQRLDAQASQVPMEERGLIGQLTAKQRRAEHEKFRPWGH